MAEGGITNLKPQFELQQHTDYLLWMLFIIMALSFAQSCEIARFDPVLKALSIKKRKAIVEGAGPFDMQRKEESHQLSVHSSPPDRSIATHYSPE